MPWTISDADRFKKGMSPEQKAKWVAIANSARTQCIKKGTSEKVCDGRAVRIANAMSESKQEAEFITAIFEARDSTFSSVILVDKGKVIR